jgi:hypothetical protein
MRVLKHGNNNSQLLGYTPLVRPILEYGVLCWDPYREGQVSALNWVQRRAGKFANHTNELCWETLAQRRMIAQLCTLYKAYTERPAWKVIGDSPLKPCNLNRDDHERKIRSRKQRTDVGK